MRATILFLVLMLSAIGIHCSSHAVQQEDRKPNIIFILSDDLNWGDLGCYGQQKIKTPHIDRLAQEGMKFTQAYCGNSVCAPSRSSLMQGLHPGHARVRGNAYRSFRESLQPDDYTVAMMLKEAGYKTGLFGKWGLALHNQYGIPNNMGFDEFYGYLNQRQAHTYYPEFLYHNKERVYYPENKDHFLHENYSKPSDYDDAGMVMPNRVIDPSKVTNSFDVYTEKSLDFVRQHKNIPFFLYLAYTMPHGPLIVPELGEYKSKEWPMQYKEWAGMVTYMDQKVGDLMNLLEELGIDDDTMIFFASDNGDSSDAYEKQYKKDETTLSISSFFDSSSPTRGIKGDSYDGAFHVPALVRWPGHIAPNQTSDQIWAFWDFLPTAADIVGVAPPSDIDGISILPTLVGKGNQKQHDYLYWEYNQNQAIRDGKWFAHRANGGDVELYDLIADPEQSKDLSSQFPELSKEMEIRMDGAHTPSDVWPSPGEGQDEFKQRLIVQNIPDRLNNVGEY